MAITSKIKLNCPHNSHTALAVVRSLYNNCVSVYISRKDENQSTVHLDSLFVVNLKTRKPRLKGVENDSSARSSYLRRVQKKGSTVFWP